MQSRSGPDQREDDRVVADFLARTSDGLEGAYRAHGAALYSVARHVLGNDEDAQDCVHDALLRIWQRPESYRPERGSLRSYLLACVRNEAISRVRSAARHLRIEQRAARSDFSTYEPSMSDPTEQERLRLALAALPSEQRAALELAYFGHLTHVQIATRLDQPLGTIKSRIALALRKLNAALIEEGSRTR